PTARRMDPGPSSRPARISATTAIASPTSASARGNHQMAPVCGGLSTRTCVNIDGSLRRRGDGTQGRGGGLLLVAKVTPVRIGRRRLCLVIAAVSVLSVPPVHAGAIAASAAPSRSGEPEIGPLVAGTSSYVHGT